VVLQTRLNAKICATASGRLLFVCAEHDMTHAPGRQQTNNLKPLRDTSAILARCKREISAKNIP
jgi:hypothetical protein